MKQKWFLMKEVSEGVILALPEKCTPQFVLTVKLRPKYLSSPTLADQFTAGNAFLTTGDSKDNLHQALLILQLICMGA